MNNIKAIRDFFEKDSVRGPLTTNEVEALTNDEREELAGLATKQLSDGARGAMTLMLNEAAIGMITLTLLPDRDVRRTDALVRFLKTKTVELFVNDVDDSVKICAICVAEEYDHLSRFLRDVSQRDFPGSTIETIAPADMPAYLAEDEMCLRCIRCSEMIGNDCLGDSLHNIVSDGSNLHRIGFAITCCEPPAFAYFDPLRARNEEIQYEPLH